MMQYDLIKMIIHSLISIIPIIELYTESMYLIWLIVIIDYFYNFNFAHVETIQEIFSFLECN